VHTSTWETGSRPSLKVSYIVEKKYAEDTTEGEKRRIREKGQAMHSLSMTEFYFIKITTWYDVAS